MPYYPVSLDPQGLGEDLGIVTLDTIPMPGALIKVGDRTVRIVGDVLRHDTDDNSTRTVLIATDVIS